jgi:hypothetical protein
LDSWLEAYACRLKTVTLDFTEFLGLEGTGPGTLWFARMTQHERAVLTRRIGLDAERLTAIALQPYDGSLVCLHPGNPAAPHPARLAPLRPRLSLLPGLPG